MHERGRERVGEGESENGWPIIAWFGRWLTLLVGLASRTKQGVPG